MNARPTRGRICPVDGHWIRDGEENPLGGCAEHGTREPLRIVRGYLCAVCLAPHQSEDDADRCCAREGTP